jgi:FdhD protein
MQMLPPKTPRGAVQLEVLRVGASGVSTVTDSVAEEEPLEIRVCRPALATSVPVRETIAVTMRTPGDDAALAAGFLWTEGILRNREELERVDVPRLAIAGQPSNTIDLFLRKAEETDAPLVRRNFFVSSSCGVCGKGSIQALHAARPAFRQPCVLRVAAGVISSLPDTSRKVQAVFDSTGGLHAASLFSADGKLLLVREDVGRHNAVDKIVGTLLLEGRLPADECVLLVSGRTSFELVQKAAMAGIQMIAAVGAPSSLAVSTADASGITLLGFVRDGRFNVYTHAERVLQAATVVCAE